jgi:glycosyltransferase involved in cell wall biosynthesis
MIALNEEARIGKALDSLGWADEVVVIDGASTDRTVEIARAKGARVAVHPWPGNFGTQIIRSVEATTGDWVFRLDCDEVVTPELAQEMRGAVVRADAAEGYRVRRKNYFLGKWIRHGGWWPDPQLRLVRRAKARVQGAPGHETLHVEGRIEDLDGAIEHDTHPTLEAAISRITRYSRHLAPDRAKRKRIRAIHLFTHPAAAFLRKYVVQSGWRDGVHGYLVASIHAMVKLAVYAQAWEIQRRNPTDPSPR